LYLAYLLWKDDLLLRKLDHLGDEVVNEVIGLAIIVERIGSSE
jgi:hypothetical protein